MYYQWDHAGYLHISHYINKRINTDYIEIVARILQNPDIYF